MSDTFRVLLVEDEPDIREIAMLSLELDPKLEVRAFGDAANALQMLSDEDWRPDLVLLDVMMAEIDGVAALRRLRELPGGEALTVAFITARTREADIAALLAAGAVAVITKPFAPLQLAQQVRDIIEAV